MSLQENCKKRIKSFKCLKIKRRKEKKNYKNIFQGDL